MGFFFCDWVLGQDEEIHRAVSLLERPDQKKKPLLCDLSFLCMDGFSQFFTLLDSETLSRPDLGTLVTPLSRYFDAMAKTNLLPVLGQIVSEEKDAHTVVCCCI